MPLLWHVAGASSRGDMPTDKEYKELLETVRLNTKRGRDNLRRIDLLDKFRTGLPDELNTSLIRLRKFTDAAIRSLDLRTRRSP